MTWSEDRLLWIFGSSRSGSTWLLRMLADLRGIVPIDDPHLGHHLGVWRPLPLAWAIGEEPPRLNTLLDLKRDEPGYFFSERYRDAWWEPLRELVRSRFEAQARELPAGEEPRRWVVKEPGSHVATLCTDLFPESKLLFLLRDGRDVVDSWLAAYSSGSWAIEGGAFAVDRRRRLPLIRWLAAVWDYRTREVRSAFERHPPQRRLLLRYEDLRARPAEHLAELAALLELDVDAAELGAIAERHAFERVPPARRGPRKEIRRAAPGSWRRRFSAPEVEAMHEEMGETLALVGYPVGPAELPLRAAG